jgi:hypothetical protein
LVSASAAPVQGAAAQGAAAQDGAARGAGIIIVARDVKIGMRRGTALRARIYRPAGATLRPAILSLESDTSAARDSASRALTAAGYAVVIAAPRGGDDRHVGRDGYDAVEWINDQSWSDRHVVMVGTGEGANAAWSAARERPPHLDAILARVPARPLDWKDGDVSRVSVPVLTVAGLPGQPQGFAIETSTRYAHAGGGTHVGFLVLGALSASQFQDLEQEWCDWILGRAPRPPLLRGRVNYMVLTDSSWRSVESLDAIGALAVSYPLHTDAGPRAAPGGFLGGEARDEEPADTVGAAGKRYETSLRDSLTIVGQPEVTLWLSQAAGRAVQVSLDEIRRDGSVVPLGTSSGHRWAGDTTALVAATPSRWEFTAFAWTAQRFEADERLRLTVSGAGVVVYHDVERYSRLTLPEVKRRF